MTLSVSKPRRRMAQKAMAGKRKGKSLQSLRKEFLVGDVYVNGKRKTGGLTVFELAARRNKRK